MKALMFMAVILMPLELQLVAPEKLPMPAAVAGDGIDLTGIYHLSGDNGGGEIYQGVATIIKYGDGYMLQMIVKGDADSRMVGTGQLRGDTLYVGWSASSGAEHSRGLTIYRIDGTTLLGQYWAFPGAGEGRSETLRLLGRWKDIRKT